MLRKPFSAKPILLAAALALLGVLAAAGVALAQNPTPQPVTDDQVNEIARGLYCPVCENIPVEVCGTQACAQWRDLIREKLALGWNERQIKDYFAAYYGDRVLETPPARGLNLLVYVLPPLFFLAGAFLVFRVLRSMRRATSAQPPAAPPESNPYLSKFDEMAKKDD